MAQMMGLIQARRDSVVASDELREMLGRADSALMIHWRGFMKTAADVLNGQQGSSEPHAHGAATSTRPLARDPNRGGRPRFDVCVRVRDGA